MHQPQPVHRRSRTLFSRSDIEGPCFHRVRRKTHTELDHARQMKAGLAIALVKTVGKSLCGIGKILLFQKRLAIFKRASRCGMGQTQSAHEGENCQRGEGGSAA